MANTPCVQDQGLYSEIPDSGVYIKSFVEAYHRLGGDLEVLRTGFHLEPWQLYAAMAFYCANKELFDAEYERLLERRRNIPQSAFVSDEVKRAWSASLLAQSVEGKEATDEEMDADLERLS